MAEVFELRPHFEWRGLGFISQSALAERGLRDLDAERRFSVPGVRVADPRRASAARCSRASSSLECKVFGTACTPEHAIGRAWSRRRAPARPTTTTGDLLVSVSSREERILGIIETAARSGRGSRTSGSRWRTAPAEGHADADRGAGARLRLEELADAAPLDDMALTTDSFVVKPLRFPGGSIGELAVNGTVNDLAMAGARRSRSAWR